MDESRWFLLIVQPEIGNNLIGKDTTICYGQSPGLTLGPVGAGPTNGNGSYSYNWIDTEDSGNWQNNYIDGAYAENLHPSRFVRYYLLQQGGHFGKVCGFKRLCNDHSIANR